ncbi:uncharacterized protein BYT42DRAFT_548226 [Radiomyces spectabilis]|uniref:uncharacterized protein n=1 Tax=Radiomyces spectabilis TaxID=64574 RepID=UPI002220FBD7|nr:uncharacterized protein BYT42DRAFT_548226 [Radiomyces spectabilis]KAI8371340.1 hypothetical protein BYT42DRAFT_548226 [Radiomyces spectabilis]
MAGYVYPKWSPLFTDLAGQDKAIAKLCAYKPYDANDWNRVVGNTADIQLFYQENLDEHNREFAGLSAASLEEQTATRMPANLIRYSAWLLQKAHKFGANQWSLFPFSSHQVGKICLLPEPCSSDPTETKNSSKTCGKQFLTLTKFAQNGCATCRWNQFANTIETGGVMTRVKFVKRWDRSQRSVITSCKTDINLHLEEERSKHVFHITNGEYQKQANIQPCYDEIKEAPPSVFTMDALKNYIEAIARNHQKLHTYIQLRIPPPGKRALVYSQRQMVLDKMTDTLLGDPAEPKIPCQWAYENFRESKTPEEMSGGQRLQSRYDTMMKWYTPEYIVMEKLPGFSQGSCPQGTRICVDEFRTNKTKGGEDNVLMMTGTLSVIRQDAVSKGQQDDTDKSSRPILEKRHLSD